MKLSKNTIEALWAEFGDVPVNDCEEILESFCGFEVFTYREYIWRWFDEQYAAYGGVHALMFPNEHKKRYTYRVGCNLVIDVDIDAANEDEAQEIYEGMLFDGMVEDRLRDELIETEVYEVWEGGIEDGICIYSNW